MKVSVFDKKQKQHTIVFPTFKLHASTFILSSFISNFMTDPLNINFDDIGIWILGFMIVFSCPYIP